ncbi:unnamed protein product [Tenebrio molitor]|nr:unnamed protein product [Tenebrio molitor]
MNNNAQLTWTYILIITVYYILLYFFISLFKHSFHLRPFNTSNTRNKVKLKSTTAYNNRIIREISFLNMARALERS